MPRRRLFVHRSNRTELLATALGEILSTPWGGPLDTEHIVVQGRGMAQYLMLELARRDGIFSNAEFPFPRRFVERAFDAVLGAGSVCAAATAPQRLRFVVMAELEPLLQKPEFRSLRAYLDDDPRGLRRFQLCREVARIFDQYVVYRPELVLAWENGDPGDLDDEERWQMLLWRAVAPKLGKHAAALEQAFERELERRPSGSLIDGLPRRAAVFGVSSLPPLYIRVLARLARHLDLYVFLLAAAKQAPAQDGLLASLGRTSYELEQILSTELERAGVDLERRELFAAPRGDRLLDRLQLDLFGGDESGEGVPAPLAANDVSIGIHACHSPMRELEVLRDRLLDAFARDPTLEPRDVVVMLPDVEAYAPLVEAVFARDPSDPTYLPFRIADRALRRESAVMEAFARLLALVGGRATASEVLDLLRLDPVRRKFDIAAEEIDVVVNWVIESGIRWGTDAEHRTRHGQPEVAQNTWRFGVDRLLVGYALCGDGRELFAGTLPYDEIEGQPAELLGKLCEYVSCLFAELERLSEPRAPSAWRDVLGGALDRLFYQSKTNAWQHQKLRRALNELVEHAEAAGFAEPVELGVIRLLLDEALDDSAHARGFLKGGITFCAMVPMRSIPFRVLCLCGMSDGQFPRDTSAVEFDLLRGSHGRRPGDRSRREDDRQLFLETLLAARDQLLITYVGQSVQDDSKKPPSVVVSELAEELLRRFGGSADGQLETRLEALHAPLFVRHPLQGFSRRYFDGSDERLYGYAPEQCEGARLVAAERARAPALFDTPLVTSDRAAPRVVGTRDLLRFFGGPIIWLYNRTLDVSLRETDEDVPDREPWQLSPLEKHKVGSELFALALDGRSSEGLELARARGTLPAGTPGLLLHDEIASEVIGFAARVAGLRDGSRSEPLSIHRRLPSGVQLSGQIGHRFPGGLVIDHYARIKGKYVLGAWIRHLLFCFAEPSDAPWTTLVARTAADRKPKKHERGETTAAEVWRFEPVGDAASTLETLVSLFVRGCTDPLLLLPSSSFEYARARHRGASEDEALRLARVAWGEGPSRPEAHTERDDPHYARVFGDRWAPGQPPPFESESTFQELAELVFEPLFAHVRSRQ